MTRPIVICGGTGSVAAGATTYFMASGSSDNATEGFVRVPVPVAGTLSALYVESSSAPAANTYVYKVDKNGSVTSTPTCTITTSGTTCNQTGQSLSITAGDTVSVQVVTGASSGSAIRHKACVEIDPT